jgi:hypothetical protein
MWYRVGLSTFLLLLFSMNFLTGCGPQPCASVFDCPSSQICEKDASGKGTCVDKKAPSEKDKPDGGNDTDPPKDDKPDTPPTDDKPDTPPTDDKPDEDPKEVEPDEPPLPTPAAGDLVINEILPDPAGDANKDGKVSTSTDEFIEIYNSSDKELDLSGVKIIGGKKGELFVFPDKTALKSKQFAVIFSGGTPKKEDFNGALIFVKSLQALSNTGDTIKLQAADGTELDNFEYGAKGCDGGKDQSVNRCGDYKPGTCQLHKTMSPNGDAFSPGAPADPSGTACKPQEPVNEVVPDGGPDVVPDTNPDVNPDTKPDVTPDTAPDTKPDVNPDNKPDAGPDTTPDVNPDTKPDVTPDVNPDTKPDVTPDSKPDVTPDTAPDSTPTARAPKKGDLVINEVLADPDTDAIKGDANKDGKRDSQDDEFIEIVNVSNATLTMKDAEIVIEDSNQKQTRFFLFPTLSLKPRGVVVVFGGGNVSKVTQCNPIVYTARSGAPALSNSGRTIILKDSAGGVLSSLKYTKGSTSTCPGDQNQSVNLSPELKEGTCIVHSKLSTSKALFSPGTKSDGTCF